MNILANIFDYNGIKFNYNSLAFYFVLFSLFYFITILIRFKNQLANEEYFEIKKRIPSYKLDKIIKIIIFVNYILFLFNYSYVFSYSQFRFSKLIYQAVMVYSIFSSLLINYFPWFTLMPFFIKSTTIYLEHRKLLSFFFTLSLFLSYFGLSNRPYIGRKNYDRFRTWIIILALLSFFELF